MIFARAPEKKGLLERYFSNSVSPLLRPDNPFGLILNKTARLYFFHRSLQESAGPVLMISLLIRLAGDEIISGGHILYREMGAVKLRDLSRTSNDLSLIR